MTAQTGEVRDAATPREARLAMREGRWTAPTVYKVPGFVQTNLVVLRRADAYDFLLYCQRNQAACPLLEVTEPGDPEPRYTAPGADLRTDLPSYNVYADGRIIRQVRQIRDLWQPDSVAFLIGSSLSFDYALQRIGVELPPDVWVLRTNLDTRPAGRFRGKLVVTLRWFKPADAIIATQLTARFPLNHGAPIHIGRPADIGADIQHPIAGAPIERIPEDRLGVFWACGVTPQQAAVESAVPWMITHTPGHAFITDLRIDQICQP